MGKELIAHVREKKDGTWAEPHSLKEHLNGTAQLAGKFANSFNSSQFGEALGLFHDLGKATEKWQNYLKIKSGYDEEAHLENKKGKVEHSIFGAALAEMVFGKHFGKVLAYCIAGHHAGLPDFYGAQSSMLYRLEGVDTKTLEEIPEYLINRSLNVKLPFQFNPSSLEISLWIRMLFSCLVDADFLDTEKYMEIKNNELRGGYKTLSELKEVYDSSMANLSKKAFEKESTKVNIVRQEVLADCFEAAKKEPGFFSLTAPTGSGKTLASMGFALSHAIEYKKDRIIYVIPYTSIIEQNADVFRSVFGKEQIIEHHSNIEEENISVKSRLSSENWDAPIIVTTSVQFFESLFAAKTSRCRKLHNIVNSVVILDEAQLLPVEHLSPILATMNALKEQYGVSFVFCTATLPAFEARESFPGLPKNSIREIIKDVSGIYKKLERVKVEQFNVNDTRDWDSLSEELRAHDSVLCVVSDRKSCRELHTLMPKGTYHLSASMCPQHRSELIEEIKTKLNKQKPVKVISTQLVEAGVDIDFPVVYRALAGLDSIAQAAGRCNREGKLNSIGEMGKLFIFTSPRRPPVGILRKAADTSKNLLNEGLVNPLDHRVFEEFFSELYWKANSLDKYKICKLLSADQEELGIQFSNAANKFKIIDDMATRSILVPYNEGETFIEQLKSLGPERWLLRKLQRYSVTIYKDQFYSLQNRGSVEEIHPGIFALKCGVEYSNETGILVEELPEQDSYIT
ncbi:CRISPR-associated helicase Cas3' [Spirochaetota bacterium]